MSSPNDQNPNQTPTRNTQSLNWIQAQTEMPLHSPSSQACYPTPSPPPQGYYPTPSPPPQGYYPPQGHYPPQAPHQGYYHPQAPHQTFHPQQTFTALLTQNEGLETINPSLSQPHSTPSLSQPHSTPSEDPSENTSNKQKAKGKQKAKSREWTIDECEALAKSWIHVSEDAIVGRGQQAKDFWKRITNNFNERMERGPDYRAKDQVYSKYTKMNPEVAFFNDTYLSVAKSNPSGWNETRILQRVNKIYAKERGKPFAFQTVWEIVRHSEKWVDDCNKKKRGPSEDEDEDDEPSQPSKKSRTSGSDFSDAHTGFNLNEFAAPSPPEEPQEPRVQPRARPAGRDKSKAQARDKGKAKEAPPALQSKVNQINDKLERLLATEGAKLEQRDMRMLFLDTTHMSGAARAAAEKVKERIRAKYNLLD